MGYTMNSSNLSVKVRSLGVSWIQSLTSCSPLWFRVFRQLRAELKQPPAEPPPTREEREKLTQRIMRDAFGKEAANPTQGHVTIRRLNRSEYRNAIRNLFGIDFDNQVFFPADDSGHGLTTLETYFPISPLLLEKYVDAANAIVKQAVPSSSSVIRRKEIAGVSLLNEPEGSPSNQTNSTKNLALELSYYESKIVSYDVQIFCQTMRSGLGETTISGASKDLLW
jgi:hypothetical protein